MAAMITTTAAPEPGSIAAAATADDDRAYLEARWRAVVTSKGDAAAAGRWWEEVVREYGGPGRRYVGVGVCGCMGPIGGRLTGLTDRFASDCCKRRE